MKGVYARGNQLWLRYTDAQGKRCWTPSGFELDKEKEAAAALAIIQRQVAAEKNFAQKAEAGEELPTKGVTVKAFGEHWNARRLKKPDREQAAKEDKWKLLHIYESLGRILITEFRTKHGRAFVEELRAKLHETKKLPDGSPAPALAPRTIRSIWGCLHHLFRAAVVAELIPVNPCVLEPGDLPPNEDANPEWRDSAVFERWEVEQLISDERVPAWRRVLWACLFLAGPRPGEVFAALWGNYDTRTQPLGRLTLVKAWNTRYKRVGRTKTRKRRLIPVHPTLAKVLATWKLSGWEAHVGRAPTPGDLLISNPGGGHLRVDDTLDWIREDLSTLGLRADRRQYDSRRTFLSLAQGDGASQELIRWVTHGARGTVVDDYTSIPWVPICNEVAKLRVELLAGRLVQMKAVGTEKETVTGTVFDSLEETPMIPLADGEARTPDLLITKATRLHHPLQSSQARPKNPPGMRLVEGGGGGAPSDPTVSLSHPDWQCIRAKLTEAEEAAASHDAAGLRQRLQAILTLLAGARP